MLSAADGGPFNPLRRSKYSDLCPAAATSSTPWNTMTRTLHSRTSRSKGETNAPQINRAPKATPPARAAEAKGQLTVITMSRKETAVPCTHHKIYGMTHNIITAE